MAKDRRYGATGGGGSGAGSGMHLFDFNETLAARRLLEDKRIAMEMQMERFYRGRPAGSDSGTPRHSGVKRDDAEMIRNALRSSSEKKTQHGTTTKVTPERQRSPNVVARLMGLEALPTQAVVTPRVTPPVVASVTTPKKKKPGKDAGHTIEKPQPQPQPRKQIATKEPLMKESPRLEHHQQQYHQPNQHHQYHQHHQHEPDVLELQKMERQLVMKQMLVREKLNEAKRLLTHDNKWASANEKLNQSKQFLDAVDYFQTNRDALLGYMDEDTVVHRHGNGHGDGMGNPIVRRVIEERRNDELRLFLGRQAEMKKSREQPPPVTQVPTRIVVLKPNPSKNPALRPVANLSPRNFSDVHELIEAARPPTPAPPVKKLPDVVRDEVTANPREIAKEIARQVRENVVRELARSEEQSTDKRIVNFPKNGFTSDYSRGGTPTTDVTIDEGLPKRSSTRSTSPESGRAGKTGKLRARTGLDQAAEDRKPGLKKTVRGPRPSSPQGPSSTPNSKPKGIVVLVPNSGNSIGETRKQSRKDTRPGRRSHQQSETTPYKLGQSVEKPVAEDECRSEESTNDQLPDADQVPECTSDSGLGYGGSFLLRSSSADNEEASLDIRTVEESGYVSDYNSDVVTSRRAEASDYNTDAVTSRRAEAEGVSRLGESPESSGSLQCEASSVGPPTTDDSDRVSGSIPPSSESQENAPESEISEATIPTKEEGVSVTSDNSGQPSPVSVLDSSFEESPSRVDYEAINSELEELRLQLSRLKWDQQDQEDEVTSPELDKMLVVDKVVVEPQPQTPEVTSTTELDWLEWECYHTGDLHCPEGTEDDLTYVKMVLLASELITNNVTNATNKNLKGYHDGASRAVKKNPKGYHDGASRALDSSVFEKLEDYYRNFKFDHGGKSRRRILFDLVKEVVEERCHGDSSARLKLPAGNFLLPEVWSKICDFYEYPQGEDLQGTVEMLIEKYMSKGDKWIGVEGIAEEIGLEIEAEVFRELLDETVDCILA